MRIRLLGVVALGLLIVSCVAILPLFSEQNGMRLVRNTPVPGIGSTIVFNPRFAKVFTTTANGVAVIDAATGNLTRVPLPHSADLLAIDSRTGAVFVASGSGLLSVLRGGDALPSQTADIGVGAFAMAVDERRGHLFVATLAPPPTRAGRPAPCSFGCVSMLDAATGRLRTTATLGVPAASAAHALATGSNHVLTGPGAAALDAQAGRLLIVDRLMDGNQSADSVSAFDTATGAYLRTFRVGASPYAIAVDDRQHRVYGTSGSGLYGIDLRSSSPQLLRYPAQAVPTLPAGFLIAIDARDHRVFILQPSGSIAILDSTTGRPVASIRAADPTLAACAMAVDERAQRLFVLSRGDPAQGRAGSLAELDARTGALRDTVAVGGQPGALALGNDGHIFVLNQPVPTTTTVQPRPSPSTDPFWRKVLDRLPWIHQPKAAIFDPAGSVSTVAYSR